jgi:ELWxxDGT repeat protein
VGLLFEQLPRQGTKFRIVPHGAPSSVPDNPPAPFIFELGVGEGLYTPSDLVGSNEQILLDDGRLLYSADTRAKVEAINSSGDTYIDELRYGDQLWVTDGTLAGTQMLERINQGPPLSYDMPSSRAEDFFLMPDGSVLVVGWNGTTTDLYSVDAADLSISKLADNIDDASGFAPWGNGFVLFVANPLLDLGIDEGIWITDGTAANTKLLIPGARSSPVVFSHHDFIELDNDQWLYEVEVRNDPNTFVYDTEVWLIDGNNISARHILDGPLPYDTDGYWTKLTSFGNGKYLTVVETGWNESAPWVLDVNEGTFTLLTDISLDTGDVRDFNPISVTPPGQVPIPFSTLFNEKVSLEETATDPFDLDDYFTNPGGGDLSYTVADAPSAVRVDPETNEVSASDAIAAGTYTVEVTATNDDGGSVTDSFDWTVVDTGRLKITATGEWGRVAADGPIVSTAGSVLTVGRKDGTAELFRIEPKDAATPVAKIENGKITFEGKVFFTTVSTEKPLMQGKFTVDIATMEVSGFEDEALTDDYRLVADLIDPQFKNVSIEQNKLVFQTDLVFDDTAGGSGPSYAALSTKDGPLTMSFGADGLGFGFFGGVERWSPEPIEFDLGGGSTLSIDFSELGIDYDAATDATYLMGKASVGWGGAIENGFDFLDNDSEQSLVIDLAGTATQGNYFQRGDKYLKIVQGPSGWDWDIVGEIKYEDKYDGPVPSNGILVKELAVGFDTVEDKYTGNFKANVPLFFGLDLSAALAFVSNPDLALDKIEIGVDGLDAPIGTTGIFIQGGTLGLENLALADPNAGWTYNAELTGTFGPDNDVISSPVHGKVSGTVQEIMDGNQTGYQLTGSVEVDSKVGYFVPEIVNRFASPLIDYFGIDAEAVTEFELIKATSTTALDFLTENLQFDATISLLNGVVNGTAQLLDTPLGTSQEVRQVSGSIDANLTIPEDFPLVGGMSRSGQALVLYSSDGDYSNDLASLWSAFEIDLGLTTLESAFGAELKFNGDLRFLGRKDIPKTSSWDLDGTDDLVILSARWEIRADDVALELILPDGTILDEAAITARDDMALVDDLNTDRARHIALSNPEAGTWDLRVADAAGLGLVSYEASEMLSSATADIVSLTPDQTAHEAEMVIRLDAGDAETVEVVVFASQETDQVAGIEVARVTMAAGDPDVVQVIDFDDLGPGEWHIYTRTDADGLVPVVEMYPMPIIVEGAADLVITAGQDTFDPSNDQVITIEVTNNGDRQSEPGTLTIKVPESMTGGVPVPDLDANPLVETESELQLPSLDPGDTYTVRISLPAGSETLGDTIFISSQTTGYDADLTDNNLAFVLEDNSNQVITGTAGADVLFGGTGDDFIDGLAGVDTARYSGPQSSYTLNLSVFGETTLTDRRPVGDGTDTLKNVESLDFQPEIAILNGQPLDLTVFGGTTQLFPEDFESFVELYIAYFNRAPDAIGLNFWGTAFSKGVTLSEMATLFVDQPETRATYPADLSNSDFATVVYDNVLGRIPDQAGFDFWVGALDSQAVGRDQFILSVLQGAKASPPVGATQEFITQQLADRAYLETKTDIGAYFAVHKGMSNVDSASAAMALFDGTQSSIEQAVAAIDNYYQEALDPNNGEFLMQVVGVLDNPFAT